MKKLTLNQTWKLCLTQWKWIIKQIKFVDEGCLDVENLKYQWSIKNGFEDILENDCFFCEYNHQHGCISVGNCKFCPAKEVDKEFYCMNEDYHFADEPLQFYRKLVALNKKRLQKGKK